MTKEELKELRIKNGLTVKEAAKLCFANERSWYQWEQGTRRIPKLVANFFKREVGGTG